ncbi:MAG: Tm-1-like ATP-binding domain-containing protein [Desulfomonile tiedjei]|nr:Tm-1-like ATP-binding domain-containing protein [Desulfomonile tiedjei]
MNASEEKTVLIIGTLDTKGEECLYIRDFLGKHGIKSLLVDPGPMGKPIARGDIPREEVAARAGFKLTELVGTRDKGKIIQAMTKGLTACLSDLHREGKIHGVIALGGGQGTAMGTAAMQALPLGFPKVMVSTIAAGDMRPFLQTQDIAVFPSVTDVFGLNYVFVRILENAVSALIGMVNNYRPIEKGNRQVIGATAFGVTTPGLMRMKKIFNENGYEMILFHATGIGGTAMEHMAQAGYFDGIMDWTTHEILDEVGKGIFASGKARLDVLSKAKIPCVMAPGAIDYICKGPFDGLPAAWKKRKHIIHNRNITLVRGTGHEMIKAAKFMAKKINKATVPVKILVPLRGFSEPNAEGRPFYDPETDRMFIQTLRQHLKDKSRIIEYDAHINDDSFVREGVALMMKMLDRQM